MFYCIRRSNLLSPNYVWASIMDDKMIEREFLNPNLQGSGYFCGFA